MASISENGISNAIKGILLVVVLLSLYAVLVPTAQTAGNTLNSSGVPFGSFFASNGVIWVIVMAALLLGTFAYFMKSKGK